VELWAALYIYHDTHLRSSELWFNFKNMLDSLTLCNPITPDSSVYSDVFIEPHIGDATWRAIGRTICRCKLSARWAIEVA